MDVKKLARFSSCRGVAFEIKPSSDPFAIKTAPIDYPPPPSARHWLPWGSSKRITPSMGSSRRYASSIGGLTQRTSSSHFCDLDLDDDDDEEYDGLMADIEEGFDKEEEQKDSPLARSPTQQPSKVATKPRDARLSVILLDQGLFTVYKRLFVLCLTINITFLVLACTGNFQYAKDNAALFSIANILALTICRSEACLRGVFWLAVKIFGHSWVPLRLKTGVTSFLQCLGGIHSGAGVSSVVWLIYALVLTIQDRENTSNAIIGIASIILSLLVLSCLAAFPLVRHLHHNVFERIHRFAGWASLVLVWAFITLKITYDPITKSYKNSSILLKHQEFWFTLAITILIILPWMTMRRVPVKISAPSGHASIIKFQGGVKSGILGRISPSPLSEWHAFGIISDGKQEHMMLAGAVGDFTKSLVSNPPSHLWVRTVHFAGLPYLVNMYNRVLVVATGSGICVFLSFLLQPSSADVCVLWVAKGIEQNFGKEIKEWTSGFPKDKVIVHDTAILGRPNVSQMSIDAAKNWGAEVVIVTSNPEGSRDVVNACKASGIPAFGPIWDS
ncbi:hypothetical protein DCAR_0104285 [Daucus carota subsp. sativus]|uniref:Uncharacterized protein n=1 Tax=Daucus carota subsp. sativus TaxID=79200 RepID=A0A166IQ10_DAUCS|nr:PREDICTED: uncharacterized protein LOC108223936 [Daucus carota subsp. sativus]WOG85098.1 hypothetical protein DCAR_0104285 [Daucus carota subsp. sativus]